jgi:hypothetical protein
VATGSVSAEALGECGADLVVPDLTVPEVRFFLGC